MQERGATIRAHMADIAVRFGRGDFGLPGSVHAQTVRGTAVMAERRSLIQYLADTLPRGVAVTSAAPELRGPLPMAATPAG